MSKKVMLTKDGGPVKFNAAPRTNLGKFDEVVIKPAQNGVIVRKINMNSLDSELPILARDMDHALEIIKK